MEQDFEKDSTDYEKFNNNMKTELHQFMIQATQFIDPLFHSFFYMQSVPRFSYFPIITFFFSDSTFSTLYWRRFKSSVMESMKWPRLAMISPKVTNHVVRTLRSKSRDFKLIN